jgi:hypothetical protein
MKVTTIGIELAKNLFQVHGGRSEGQSGIAQTAAAGGR